MGKDKFLHFGVCFVAALVVMFGTWFLDKTGKICTGVAFALGLGLGKEYGDKVAAGKAWNWKDSVRDLVADILGIACAVLVRILFK